MTIAEAVLAKLQTLSAEDQQKTLEFVSSLQAQDRPVPRRKDPKGLFAHRGVHISADEIDAARREAWADFPRDHLEGAAP